MDRLKFPTDEKVLETILISSHSIFGLISVAVNAYALYKALLASIHILGAYKLILINQAIVNLVLAACVLFLQLRIFITPFGSVYAVLGLASFTNHLIAFLAYLMFSSLFLDYYFLLVIAMFYNCHWIHKGRYTTKHIVSFLLLAGILSSVDFILSAFLFYENESESRELFWEKSHETVLNRHMVFAVRVHEDIFDIVVNYTDAVAMVVCIAFLIFLRYRIRVYVRRTDQRLTYIQKHLVNLIVIQAVIIIVFILLPSVFYFLFYEQLRKASCDCLMSITTAISLFILPLFTILMLKTVRHVQRLHDEDSNSVSVVPSTNEPERPSTSA
ncbi:unnamed protein product [Bursaphelenchus okinawaensis]|uniref:Uncharacterized protein n=1 Tax=Bursaphelenchus okinawaensis TaxID=465554 RepID=A0A811LDB1_9BILA|nr:unnamed protein product [Bursaphelenchus okinawaensis]CAG9123164.1 unnamed protein product [Bursaphelenchus okinawaensis]